MGFAKSGLFFLVILLFQLHLLSTGKIISQENSLVTDFGKQQKLHPRFKEKSAVSRRGGGGGVHGSGGGHGGEGAHGNGGEGAQTHGGGAVIPLFAAGAAGGADRHRNDNHRHGSNSASRGHSGLSHLLCSILMSLAFAYFV